MFKRQPESYRVLLTDDNPAILDDYRRVLLPAVVDNQELEAASADFFGDEPGFAAGPPAVRLKLTLDEATEGETAVAMTRRALDEGRPYTLAFVDMRMPPGIDGLETVKRIWAVDPDVQTVICSAHSDHSHDEILEVLGDSDRLLILRKPFDTIEVSQIASALTAKWDAAAQMKKHLADLESKVRERTHRLETTNLQLHASLQRQTQAETRLRRIALHDALTDLPNRHLLTDQLEAFAAARTPGSARTWGVLFMDLDNFKVVNDGLGHPVGDQLLIGVAKRLLGVAAEIEAQESPQQVVVARLGGDEFVVGLDGIESMQDARGVADAVRKALVAPLQIGNQEVHVELSIGMAVAEHPDDWPETLLRDADTALYRAKALGKGTSAAFDQDMRKAATERLTLETDLRRAFERDQLSLAYQPIVALESGLVVGAEALLRWTHPTLGPISPQRFIGIAEETGLIREIGRWVLEEACSRAADWSRRFPACADLTINVNVSPRQVFGGGLIEELDAALLKSGLEARRLKIEITEGILLREDPAVQQVLEQIRKRGASLLLDDFGTGYSSLSYLHRLPVDGIKLDRSFVGKITEDRVFANTVQALITLASNRGLTVVAEGIETELQLVQLQSLACDFGQGYHFARPMNAEAFDRMLADTASWRKAA